MPGKINLKMSKNYWSGKVRNESNALGLEEGVFTLDDPRKVGLSLKRSADASKRRKSSSFASAMSMLNFYINKASKKLMGRQRIILEQSKFELRRLYGRRLS